MQRFRLALACALLAALTGVAVQAILLLHAATVATRALAAAVSAEIQATRADMFNKTGTFGGAGKSGCEDPVRTGAPPPDRGGTAGRSV